MSATAKVGLGDDTIRHLFQEEPGVITLRRTTSTTEEALCHVTNPKLRRRPRSWTLVGGVKID